MRTLKRFQVKLSLESADEAEAAQKEAEDKQSEAEKQKKEAEEAATKAEKEGKEAAEAGAEAGEEQAEAAEAGAEAEQAAAEASEAAAEATGETTPEAGTEAETAGETTGTEPEAATGTETDPLPEPEVEATPEAGAETTGAEVTDAETTAGETGAETTGEAGAETAGEVTPEATGEVTPEATGEPAGELPPDIAPEAEAGMYAGAAAGAEAADAAGAALDAAAAAGDADAAAAADAAAQAAGTEVTGEAPLESEEAAPQTETQAQIEALKQQVADIGSNIDSIETGLIELEKTAAEGDVELDIINEREAALDELGQYKEIVEDSIEEGGLTPGVAQAIEIAVESRMEALGMPKAIRKPTPSMEQFTTHSARLRNTKVSLEALNINMESIKKSLVEAFKRLREWAIKFFQQIFDVTDKMVARAEKLASLAASTKGDPKEVAITDDRLFKALAVGQAVPTNLLGALQQLGSVAQPIMTGQDDLLELAQVAVKTVSGGNFAGLSKNLPLPALSAPGTTAEQGSDEGDCHTLVTPTLIGNFLVYRTGPKTSLQGEAAVEAMSQLDAGVRDLPNDIEGGQVKLLTPSQAAEAAKTISQLLQTVKAYKPVQDKLNGVKSQMANVASRINPEGMEEADVSAAKAVLGGLQKILDQPAAAVSKRVLTVSKAVLDLVEESLKSAGAGATSAAPAAGEAKPA